MTNVDEDEVFFGKRNIEGVTDTREGRKLDRTVSAKKNEQEISSKGNEHEDDGFEGKMISHKSLFFPHSLQFLATHSLMKESLAFPGILSFWRKLDIFQTPKKYEKSNRYFKSSFLYQKVSFICPFSESLSLSSWCSFRSLQVTQVFASKGITQHFLSLHSYTFSWLEYFRSLSRL